MSTEDQQRLAGLPWQAPLEEWPKHGVVPLLIRRGESRHPVIFVERNGARYAIKETTPRMAEREIHNLREIERRGIPALSPIGAVTVPAHPVMIEEHGIGGHPQYISGDRGYSVTRLAPRVVPHVLLYRIPFTRRNKRRIWSAIAVLMVELHEHGVYWGDPSLANILIRFDGRRILAILADAETVELFPGPISEGLREQDLALFEESLLWQGEDLRAARGLPEEEEVVDDSDFRYFLQRYRALRRQHERLTSHADSLAIDEGLSTLNRFGLSLLDKGGKALQNLATVRPDWYVNRIRDLLHITVPRSYARRFYSTILGHQALMSKREGHEVSIEEAARDWYTRYHLPTILLLRQHLTKGENPMPAYFSIMRHKWNLSKKAGYEVPMDEAVLDWAMHQAEIGRLGTVDPAELARWWRDRESVAQALEPPLIESESLEPLLSSGERPLVKLPQPELDQKLTGILERHQPHDEE
ncbi:MAG TPA: DUF4032 domain-containing protein [Ktedonobacteraceae bacterium]|nr:DUF4032 domain-containing protein [Ktedonobacteraceae bacterium]